MATTSKRSRATGQDLNRGQGWALGLASVASFMVVLDMLVVSTALNTIRRDLGASIAELEWTVNAYTLAFAVLLMTAAAIGDRFGRRRVFAAGLALFTVASAGCAVAPGVGWLIAARTVQGAGAAMVMPLALAVLNAAVPPQRRGWAMGIFGAVTSLAVVVGPVLGGAITQGIAWQWIFWLNVPIGLAAIALVLRRLDESYGPRAALDLPGLGLGTGAALGLVWGLVRGSSAGWGSPEVAGSLAGGAVLIVAFTRWERRAGAPMLPMRLFAARGFSAGNAVTFLLNASTTGAVFFMAQFLQVGLGLDPLEAGLRLLPWGVAPLLIAPRAGRLADQIGDRPLIVSGLALQGGGAGLDRRHCRAAGELRRAGRPRCSFPGPGSGWRFRRSPRRWSARCRPVISARRRASSARCASSAARSGSPSWRRCSRRPGVTPPLRRSATDSPPRSPPRRAWRWPEGWRHSPCPVGRTGRRAHQTAT